MIDIAKARALCAAATPGPWTFTTCYGVATVEHGPDRDAIAHAVDYLQVGDEYDNASFIASARTLLPEALDALEQERAVCVTITTALGDGPIRPCGLRRDAAMIDIAKARALCEAQYGAKSDPEVFRAAALDLLPEALTEIERVYTMNARVNDRLSDLTATLEKIAYAGSDCPPARELEAFYRSQLHYCIGTAARALTPAAGGDDV